MGPNYPILDMLAQNGIFNFDADAYIYGTPPRYGVPAEMMERPIMGNPYCVPCLPQSRFVPQNVPQKDTFIHNEVPKHKESNLKEVLLVGILSALGLFAGYKCKNNIAPHIPGTKANKAKKAAATVAAAATQKAKEAASQVDKKGFTAFLKKHWKIGAISVGSLAGLYLVYNIGSKILGHRGIPGRVPNPTSSSHHKHDDKLDLMTPGSRTPEP